MTVFGGNIILASDLNEIYDLATDNETFLLTSSLSPLTSTANTNTQIVAGSYDFVDGYAYEIIGECRFTVDITATSTAEGRALFGFTRANAAGTAIFNSGYVAMTEDNIPAHFYGSQIVKVTGGNTTQTISFNGQFSTAATGVSMAISVNSTVTPGRLTIRRIGLASQHSTAIELPTA